MEKEFATYEIAYELKRLGFNEKCLGFWSVNLLNSSYTELKYGMKLFTNDSVELSDHESNVLAPLWQQVIDWLAKTYDVYISISIEQNEWKWKTKDLYYSYAISHAKNNYDGYDANLNVWLGLVDFDPNNQYHICKSKLQACSEAINEVLDNLTCSHNGLKREGGSCSLNNNCTYPKCLIFKDPLFNDA